MLKAAFILLYTFCVAVVSSCGPYRNAQWLEDNVAVSSPTQQGGEQDPAIQARWEQGRRDHAAVLEKWSNTKPREETSSYQVWAENRKHGVFKGSALVKVAGSEGGKAILSGDEVTIENGIVTLTNPYRCWINGSSLDTSEGSGITYEIDSGIYEVTGSGRTKIQIPMGNG